MLYMNPVHAQLLFNAPCKNVQVAKQSCKSTYLSYHGKKCVTETLHMLYSWPAICIHGDKAQAERDWALNGECVGVLVKLNIVFLWCVIEFRKGQSTILLATDVASRGLGKVSS